MLEQGLSARCVRALAAAALLLLGLAPTAVHAAQPNAPARKVVVLPMGSLGVEEEVATSLLGFLRAEIARLPGTTVVDLSKVHKPQGVDCRGEERCLAAAGAKMGADVVVAGTVAGVGEAYSIDLKAVVAKTGREDTRITEVISGERELLIDGIRGVAYKLLLPSQYAGTIQVDLAEKGAEVFVDGRPAGKSPLKAPIPNLTPGKHALKIVMAGYADFDKWVDVRFARVSVVKVDLKNSSITGVMFEKEHEGAAAGSTAPAAAVEVKTEPPPPPPIVTGQRVGAIVVAGLGLAAAGGGFYFADAAQKARNRATVHQLPGGGVTAVDAPEVRGHLDAMTANAVAADALWIAGGVAVAGAIVLWFTGAAPEAKPVPVVSVGPGGASLGVAGSF
ncbi:MAG: PEGA domain-containing protein [Myxococcales bacterium]